MRKAHCGCPRSTDIIMEQVEACRLVPGYYRGAGEDVWNLDMFGR